MKLADLKEINKGAPSLYRFPYLSVLGVPLLILLRPSTVIK